MDQIRINLLGGFGIEGCGDVMPSARVAALVGYLALHPNRAQTRDKLAALFWADSSEHKARSSLRQILSTVRKHAPELGTRLIATRDWVSLQAGSWDTDSAEFESKASSHFLCDKT